MFCNSYVADCGGILTLFYKTPLYSSNNNATSSFIETDALFE